MIIRIANDDKVPKCISKELTFGMSDLERMSLFENGEIHIGTIRSIKNGLCIEIDEVLRNGRTSSIKTLDYSKPADLKLIKMALAADFGLEESEYIIE